MSKSARDLTRGLDVLEASRTSPRAESEIALAGLGLEVEHGEDTGAVMRVLSGLTTSGGHARQTRLEHCGVAYLVLCEDGEIRWARMGCRDRFCGPCGDRLGDRLGSAVAHKAAQCQQVVSVVVTRPKVAEEEPGEAIGAASKACSQLMQSPLCKQRGKKGPPPILPGGARFLEVTAREKGQRVGTYVVPERGIHAHVNIIAQVRADWTIERATAAIIETWQGIVEGAAAGAQRVAALGPADIARAAAYASKFGVLARLVDVAPSYARAVAAAMHGRVLAKAWGSWRNILKPVRSGARFADRSIANIMKSPGGIVRFGDQAWQASDLYRMLLQRPKKMGDDQ